MASAIKNFATEAQLQSACYMWYQSTFPLRRKLLFHVDNNSWNRIIGAQKKALGVVSGPSDFVFVVFCSVIFIEMKLPTGTQSDEQKDFEEKVRKLGHKYIIIRTLESFQKFITETIENEMI